MLTIDGSRGEGGGQVLRTALGLSLVTGTPFCITRIRAGRSKPGLLRQHLTAVRAATEMSEAEVSGDTLGSSELTFRPGSVKAGAYSFSIGSAGSASLVLQTVLPGLLRSEGVTEIAIEGGTHNPLAPPFEFLNEAFMPLLTRMGARIELTLDRHGFMPAGGGRLRMKITPARLMPIEILHRGELVRRSATAIISAVPLSVARRELDVIQRELGLTCDETHLQTVASTGPGNAVLVLLEHTSLTEVFIAFGERRVPAETVARNLCREISSYLASDAPVGPHLADQLQIPFALAGGGVFRTIRPTHHTITQLNLIQEFLDVPIHLIEDKDETYKIQVGRGA